MVQCKGCAFLSLKHSAETRYFEADDAYRTTGSPGPGHRPYAEDAPVCFAMAADLAAEVRAVPAGGESGLRTLAVIAAGRECGEFVPRMIGYTPKEMADKVFYDKVLKEAEARRHADKERDEQRIGEDRAWRESQEAKATERRERQDEKAALRRKEREDLEWRRKLLLTLAGIVLSGVFTLVGYWVKGFVDRQVNEARQQSVRP